MKETIGKLKGIRRSKNPESIYAIKIYSKCKIRI